MAEERLLNRRLAAILAADIAGYSRLMHEDEAATVRDLKAHQSVILPLIGRPGGVLVSSTVYDHVRGKLPVTFVDAGERQLKNIEQPVRTYRALIPGVAFTPGAALFIRTITADRRRWIVLGLAALLVLLAARGAWWVS